MNKTQIEWVKNPDGSQGYTWNPITGCLNHDNGLCKGGGFPCYAYKLANGRLKQRYITNHNILPAFGSEGAFADPFYPRFWEERLFELSPIAQTHKGIFVCDMSDLFGIGIPKEWTLAVLGQIRIHPEHRFYLLTKQPQNLIKFSPFPDNCWVGVTATNTQMFMQACSKLEYPLEAKLKYISLEPLLAWDFNWNASYLVNTLGRPQIGWLIIGACTGTYQEMSELREKYPDLCIKAGDSKDHLQPSSRKWTAQPSIEWVREIIEAADKAGVKVFLKDNLLELVNYHSPETDFAFNKEGCYRQEMPEV